VKLLHLIAAVFNIGMSGRYIPNQHDDKGSKADRTFNPTATYGLIANTKKSDVLSPTAVVSTFTIQKKAVICGTFLIADLQAFVDEIRILHRA